MEESVATTALRIVEVPTQGEPDLERAAAAEVLVYNAGGQRPPLVTIRTWSKEGEHFRALARALGPDQPILSLAPPDFPTLEQYPRTTEEWVELLLPIIRRLDVEGPWLLGGWSFGGVLALELGERLAAEGDAVALVLMIDTRKPRSRPETKPGVRMPVRLRKLGRSLVEYSSYETRAERLAYLRKQLDPTRMIEKRRARVARRTERSDRKTRRQAERAARAPATTEARPEGLIVTRWTGERMTFLQRTIHVAYLKYRSHPTQLPIALLRTRESRERSGDDPALGWWPLVRGRFAVEEIDGDHWTIFDPAHVERLAPRVDRVLRQAVESVGERRETDARPTCAAPPVVTPSVPTRARPQANP
ncbi:MAG: thioesterase domain-containing protein [Myxococcota bacterium]